MGQITFYEIGTIIAVLLVSIIAIKIVHNKFTLYDSNQDLRAVNNKNEHISIVSALQLYEANNGTKNEVLLKSLTAIKEQLSVLQVVVKNEVVNNSDLKQKLHVVLESIDYTESNMLAIKFREAMTEIISVTAEFYKIMRTAGLENIDYTHIKKMQGKLAEIFLIRGLFNVQEIEKLNTIASKILSDFNREKAASDNVILITKHFRVFAKEVYVLLLKYNSNIDGVDYKNNNINTIGNNNTNVQDNTADNITINLNK